jgi:PKD repeat protein
VNLKKPFVVAAILTLLIVSFFQVKVVSAIGPIQPSQSNVVAFDISRGQNPGSECSEFIADLQNAGFTVATINIETQAIPSNLEKLIIYPRASGLIGSLYTESEATMLEDWVSGGGELFVMCEWGDFALETQSIVNAFEVYVQTLVPLGMVLDYDDFLDSYYYVRYQSDNFLAHPILSGVTEMIQLQGTFFLNPSAPDTEYAPGTIIFADHDTNRWPSWSYITLAIAKKWESGRVAMFGDSTWLTNAGYSLVDNTKVAMNTIRWLNGLPPTAYFEEDKHVARIGETISFDGSGSSDPDGSIVLYEWDWENDGVYDFSAAFPDWGHAYPAEGYYDVRLRVTDDDGDTAVSAPQRKLVTYAPAAVFTESAHSIQAGKAITFDPSGSFDPGLEGGLILYEWDWESDGVYDLSTTTPLIVSHTYPVPGTFTVTLRVTSRNGLTGTASAEKSVYLGPPPTPIQSAPHALFSEDMHVAFVGGTINFDASESVDLDGSIILYEWDWNSDGVYDYSSTSPTASHAYSSPGLYTVTLRVTDDDGLTDTATDTKTIGLIPVETTIESCDSSGATKDTFDVADDVYVKGTGYLPSTTYDLYVVLDEAVWSDGMTIPARVFGTATAVSSDAGGNVPATLVWPGLLVLGKYDIVVDVNGNGVYDEGIDALDDGDIAVTAGLNVIPEVPLGTFMASAALIVGFACYFGMPKVRKKNAKA